MDSTAVLVIEGSFGHARDLETERHCRCGKAG